MEHNDESRPGAAPVMILAFEGWNDAGDAATAAIEHLQLVWDAQPTGEISPDEYYDYQVTRPTVRMVDGITRSIEFPTTRVSMCTPPGHDRPVLLVNGIEPNMRWRQFCGELIEIADVHDIGTVVSLGALLADTAHTRPVPVSGTAYDAESAARYGLSHSEYEGPTGITGVFQDACVRAGIPAVSFWAAIPHYVSQPPHPKATIALLHRIEDFLDIEVPLGGLPEQAEEWEQTVTDMTAEDEEVSQYVQSLEERGDAEDTMTEASGDELAQQFEQYLRRRRPGQR